MSQLRPETEEYIELCQNTDPIVFILCISLFFDLLYQRWYLKKYFWTLHLKVLAYEAATDRNRGITLQNIKIANQIVFVLSPALFFYLMYQKVY